MKRRYYRDVRPASSRTISLQAIIGTLDKNTTVYPNLKIMSLCQSSEDIRFPIAHDCLFLKMFMPCITKMF
jgi:hypothetical protein